MLQTSAGKPLFDHDCAQCTFLGRLHGADAYSCCKNDDRGADYILRFSSSKPDYMCQRDPYNRRLHITYSKYGFGPDTRKFISPQMELHLHRMVLIELMSSTLASLMEERS